MRRVMNMKEESDVYLGFPKSSTPSIFVSIRSLVLLVGIPT